MASRKARRVGLRIDRMAERAVGRLVLRVHQAVTLANPVDTGFSRAGWSPSVGAPNRGTPTRRPTDRSVASAEASALAGKHAGEAAAIDSTYQLGQGLAFIVNNVVYAERLNAGWSAQAPAMYVQRAIADAIRATAREIRQ